MRSAHFPPEDAATLTEAWVRAEFYPEGLPQTTDVPTIRQHLADQVHDIMSAIERKHEWIVATARELRPRLRGVRSAEDARTQGLAVQAAWYEMKMLEAQRAALLVVRTAMRRLGVIPDVPATSKKFEQTVETMALSRVES